MSAVLKHLDAEWRRLACSPDARRALIRWRAKQPALAGLSDFDELLDRRRDPAVAPPLLAALAALAPSDHLAVRVLLQALVPGLVRLSHTVGRGHDDAVGDMISLAWERIATYPATRHGDVAANVLRDVRKRYQQLCQLDHPRKRYQGDSKFDSDTAVAERRQPAASAEDVAMERAVLDQLRAAVRKGIITRPALRVMVQTRILGESVSELAARSGMSRNTVASLRFRAERRLRQVGDLHAAG